MYVIIHSSLNMPEEWGEWQTSYVYLFAGEGSLVIEKDAKFLEGCFHLTLGTKILLTRVLYFLQQCHPDELDLGDAVIGNSVHRSIQLQNESDCGLHYELNIEELAGGASTDDTTEQKGNCTFFRWTFFCKAKYLIMLIDFLRHFR